MQVLTLPETGNLIETDRDATDIIGEAFGAEANIVVIPVSRLSGISSTNPTAVTSSGSCPPQPIWRGA